MYIIELSGKTWEYATAQDAWDDRNLEVRKRSNLDFGTGTIAGVREFSEFKKLLDDGKVLQFHAMRVYKSVDQ